MIFLYSMAFRFTEPQAELYQAVLDIQKSCLSLCSPGMSLENIYSLMLSLIGQKLKDLGVLESSITDSHFFKVLQFFYSSLPVYSHLLLLILIVLSLGSFRALIWVRNVVSGCLFYLLLHGALIHVVGWSQHKN